MEYNLKLGQWNAVFAVPCSAVDKYIKTANETQIKVLLWVLRNSGQKITYEKFSENFEISQKDFEEAFLYWKSVGIFSLDKPDKGFEKKENDAAKEFCYTPTEQKTENLNFKKAVLRYQRPDSTYVATRVKESKEIYFLMQEAQVILGRPISSSDSAVLLMLHDNEGLPVDVILMLIQYAVGAGKPGIRYIEKTGIDWAHAGVDNLEKAEKRIHKLDHKYMLWKKFEGIIGIEHRAPTSTEEETVLKWYDDWQCTDELIKHAYEICVNANGKYVLKYMHAIIRRWHSEGIYSPEEAQMKNYSQKNKSKKTFRTEPGASYDIDEYEKFNIFGNN